MNSALATVTTHLAPALCCWNGKRTNACHDVKNDVCRPEGLDQPQVLVL